MMDESPMSRFYTKIRNFLFGAINKEFLIFLLFLFISAVFWLGMTLNETYEREYVIPIALEKVPKNVVLTKNMEDTLVVTIRDKGFMHAAYTYSGRIKQMKIGFTNFANNNRGRGIVKTSDLQRLLYKKLYGSSKIISLKPDGLEFVYNYGVSKKVPVKLIGKVVPAKSYYLARTKIWPDSVVVYASEAKLDSIKYVTTGDVNVVNFEDTVIQEIALNKINETKIVPAKVKVGLYPDILTEGSMEVPIVAINMPEGKVLRTFPSKVTVKFIVGASVYRKMKPEQFLVVADYRELEKHHSDKCNIYLRTTPHGITMAKLEINQVDYLIEQR